MLFTPEQLQEIKRIITDYHNAFVANAISPKVLAPEIIARLKAKGLLRVEVESVKDAYVYGQLLAHLENPAISTMSYEQFKTYLKRNPIPLTPQEHHAITMAQMSTGQYCVGLGNRVNLDTGNVAIEADSNLRAQLHDTIRTETAESIGRRESTQQLASRLGWKTGDWTRDWRRIANTEMHQAMQNGIADHYKERHGADVRVAKIPMRSACRHCKELFLGADGAPLIFNLSDLQANGTNVGRKTSEWLPVIGVVHPNCQCQIVRIPKNWGFNASGELVPKGTYGLPADSEEFRRSLAEEDDFHKSVARNDTITFQGLTIKIENRPGTLRHWQDATGERGDTQMLCAYGEIVGTSGLDGEAMDVFVGPDPRAKIAFIVEQQNPENGLADEQKVMLGFSNEDFALQVYRAHFNTPGYDVAVQPIAIDGLVRWLAETRPSPEEMMTRQRPILVVPIDGELGKGSAEVVTVDELSKAGGPGELTALAATGSSMAGARNPGKGTVPNILFNTPRRTPPRTDTTVFDAMMEEEEKEEQAEDAKRRRRRNKHLWDVTVPVPDHIFMLKPPKERAYENIRDGLHDERKAKLKKWEVDNSGGLLNEDHQIVRKSRSPVTLKDKQAVLKALQRK